MLSFIVGLVTLFLVLLFIYGFVNSQLKSMLDNFTNQGGIQENFSPRSLSDNDLIPTPLEEPSVRPIDDCRKYDMKGEDKVHTNVAVGIPDAPYKYNDYVGEIYIEKPNQEIGRENGPYCIKKPKLLYDGIWSPYLFSKEGYERVEWSLTNGNLFEGEVCMKSLFNTLKPMPKWSAPDCPVKCLNDGNCNDFSVYCNGPDMNDRQDITAPNDSSMICFPSIFSPDGNKHPTTKIGF